MRFSLFPFALGAAALGFAGGCQKPATTDRPPAAAAPQSPREVVAPAPNSDKVFRVMVYYDMEGVSGQDDWRTFIYGQPQYPHGRELLTADLNAVIEGLFAGGADSVDVVDSHGSTNDEEPDALSDKLDKRARVVYRDKPFEATDLTEPGRYDAVVGVANHAKTGSKGYASHTITIGIDLALNGQTVTETELVALSLGRVGVPLIMVTGDDRLQADLAGFPWIQYVVVKRSRSADSVDLIPVDQVHQEMRAKAKLAVEGAANAKAVRLTTPIKVTVRSRPPADISVLEGVPGIDYREGGVNFEAADFDRAMEGINRLVGVATLAWNAVVIESFTKGKPAREVFRMGIPPIIARWADVESGRWNPPPPPPEKPRRYHGSS